MTQNSDPRIVRTKLMLRNALMQLIEEKGFDGVTVRDLTQRAGLNRGTFYLHYRDKYDLLEQSKEEIWKDYRRLLEQVDPQVLYQYASRDEASPFIIEIFDYLKENADFFKVMLGPKGDPAYPLRMKELMRKNLYEKLTQLKPPDNKMLVPIDFLLAFVTSAQVGIVQHWLETGMTLSSREMALMVTRIVRFGPLQTTGIVELLSDKKSAGSGS